MKQPQGFVNQEFPDHVLKVIMNLYGLKQAPRTWYKVAKTAILSNGYLPNPADPCLFYKWDNGTLGLIHLHVDDFAIACDTIEGLNSTSDFLKQSFEIGEENDLHLHLGISGTVERDGTININNDNYVDQLLCEFNMQDCDPVESPLSHSNFSSNDCPQQGTEEWAKMQRIPYRGLICKLAHLSRTTRPDISYAVGVLSRFMSNPALIHWNAAKRILKYLKFRKTGSLSLNPKLLAPSSKFSVSLYVDADHAGDSDTSKSTTGYFICVGQALTAWNSKLQEKISTSSTHAEHIAAYHALTDLIWHQNILRSMDLLDETTPSVIYGDSIPSQNLAMDWMVTARSKHFDVKLRYINEQVDNGLVIFKHIPGQENIADCLTKVVTKEKLTKFMNQVGLRF